MKKSTTHRKPFDYKDYSNLDNSQDAEYLIAAMGEMCALESVRQMKKRAIQLLNPQYGEKILDVGCGLGDDAEVISEKVGLEGSVTGIDYSQKIIREAKKNSAHLNVQYQVGDANQLEFDNNCFDACRADRLLLSQKNYRQVFTEVARVLKPGGRLVITDLDHGSAIIYPYIPKLTDALVKRLQDIIENPFMGRFLPSLFREFGFLKVSIVPEPYVINDFVQITKLVDFPRMIEDLKFLGIYSAEEAELMLSSFWAAQEKEEFIYCVTMFTVLGFKPDLAC